MADRNDCDIRIRNTGGIPVVEIVGELNKAALRMLEATVGKLASAGHYHIVLNIRRAASVNAAVFAGLKRTATAVTKHYGAIDVVGEASQISQLLRLNGLTRLFRFCTSENEAIRRIKRLARLPEHDDSALQARIKEPR